MINDSMFGRLITWPAIAALVLLPDFGPCLRAQDAATTIAVDVKEVTGGVQAITRITIEREGGDKPAAVIDAIARYLQ